MARPSKLTPEVQTKLLEAIRVGASLNSACAYAGIDYSTFRMWMQRGEGTHKTRRSDRIYVEFVESVRLAEAKLEIEMVMAWRSHTKENWKAAAEFLARRFPERWSPSATLRLLVEQQLESEINLMFDAIEKCPDFTLETKKQFFKLVASIGQALDVAELN